MLLPMTFKVEKREGKKREGKKGEEKREGKKERGKKRGEKREGKKRKYVIYLTIFSFSLIGCCGSELRCEVSPRTEALVAPSFPSSLIFSPPPPPPPLLFLLLLLGENVAKFQIM